ncbi:MAG: TonB-dependent receptor, partial [Vicinamibacteraceae bacterium]
MACRIRYAGAWFVVGLMAAALAQARWAGAAQIATQSSSVGAQAAFAGQFAAPATLRPNAHKPRVGGPGFESRLGAPAAATAQAARSGSVSVVVTDPLGDRVPGADATLVGTPPATIPVSMVTDERGEALFEGLAPGTYTLRIALSGFETFEETGLVVANRRRVTREVELALSRVVEDVAVTQDQTETALINNFTQALSHEQIENLPDDPEEMAEVIQAMAGPGAVMRVNGFEGGQLPPKSQIQEVRFRFDPYSADNHQAGRPRIDIVTRPGSDELRNQVNLGFRDQGLDARSPLAPERGDGQTRRLRWSMSGPIVRNKTSYAVSVSGWDTFDAQTINAQLDTGPFSDIVDQGSRRLEMDFRVEHALTREHMLRLEYQRESRWERDLGASELDLSERAYDRDTFENRARIGTSGTFAKRFLNHLRFEYAWDSTETASASMEPTIDVLGSFTSGGAQLSGGVGTREIEVADDLQFTVGKVHSLSAGFEVGAARYHSDEQSNMNGTFTFASIEDYIAGRPIQFSLRDGNPDVTYSRHDIGWYVQDDIRLRKNLLLGVGLRHELQSQIDGKANFSPRASIAWTPFPSGKTTIRAGGGIFYDWYGAETYAQTVLVDGLHQRDLIVQSPSYPDPFAGGDSETILPSRIQAAEDLRLPRLTRVSVGVEHELAEWARFRTNYFREETSHRLRGLNINAPIDGVRPFPEFERITEVQSIGRAEEQGFDASLMLTYMPRNLFGVISYRYGRSMNDADGPLGLPADSTDLASEWGPSNEDIRHRIFSFINVQLPKGFGLGLHARVDSGAPYNRTLGTDANGDTVTNDRPEGVSRNSERGDWQKLV